MPSLTHPLQHSSQGIMTDALEKYDGKVSIGSRNISSLPFANDTDALAEEEQELEALVASAGKPKQGIRWRSVSVDQSDDKQSQWHPEADQGERTEAGYCNKLEIP